MAQKKAKSYPKAEGLSTSKQTQLLVLMEQAISQGASQGDALGGRNCDCPCFDG